jgi:hypothetical protein
VLLKNKTKKKKKEKKRKKKKKKKKKKKTYFGNPFAQQLLGPLHSTHFIHSPLYETFSFSYERIQQAQVQLVVYYYAIDEIEKCGNA